MDTRIRLFKDHITTPTALALLPIGVFKYCSQQWTYNQLREQQEILDLFNLMSSGLDTANLSFTYMRYDLKQRQCFGHGHMHVDGRGEPSEVHRLLTFNGTCTLGEDNFEMSANCIWEFKGDYKHKARPATTDCQRLALRVSNCSLPNRNHWEKN